MQAKRYSPKSFDGGIAAALRCSTERRAVMPVTITLAQRDALYEQVLNHLRGIGDVWLAIEKRDYRTADRLGREFADDLRLLLDDLGFPDDDQPPSGVVELTMSPAALARVIWRLGEEATQVYGDTLPRPEGDQELLERSSLAMEACADLARPTQRRDPMSNAKDNPKKSRPAKTASAKTAPKAKAPAKRLRPGELDGLVLAYLGERKEAGPLTPSAIAKGLGRSSGAVANCLARQAKSKSGAACQEAPAGLRDSVARRRSRVPGALP
jgi:hypothetical protein